MRTSVASFSSLTHVLCVGVNDPGDPTLPVLGTAESDAREFAATLLDAGGCAIPPGQVRCLTGKDATRSSVLNVLRTLADKATTEEAVVVFLAGHAVQRDGEFIFCPAGLDWSNSANTTILGRDIDGCIKPSRARGVLLILDCCQSAGFAENAPDSFRSLGTGEYRIVLAASRVSQRSWEMPDGRGTLFSRNLIEIVSGRVSAGGSPGTIYFSDLLQTITGWRNSGRPWSKHPSARAGLCWRIHTGSTVICSSPTHSSAGQAGNRKVLTGLRKAKGAKLDPRNCSGDVFLITAYYGFLRNSQYASPSATRSQSSAAIRGLERLGIPSICGHWAMARNA